MLEDIDRVVPDDLVFLEVLDRTMIFRVEGVQMLSVEGLAGVDVSPETYADLCIAAAETGFADVVDVEIFTGDPVVERMIAGIHAAGKPVIASSHEFRSTPAKEEMIRRLRKMQDMGADILKIAVMPETKADVLTLLSATEEMARCHAERPLVTMSMSPAGVISRICGEAFGSAMTFGAVGETSAPGQIPVDRLNTVLKIMHDAG
jgi:3-dehydroquinate dehydratase-1